jgi:ribonucleoside-diphosphate reductase beta chain
MSKTNSSRNGQTNGSDNEHYTNFRNDTFEAVIETIDEGLERLPSYMDLYFKWERQNWSVQDLDFSVDREHWQRDVNEYVRMQRMGGYNGFFSGEIDVANTLGPYIGAMPRLDQRVFLTTQLVDEARHVVFFDKWFREVLGKDAEIVGGQMEDYQSRPFGKYIFKQLLPEISDGLAKHPNDLMLLIDGVTLYHIIIEGALALAGQTRILTSYKKAKVFPGFVLGFTAVSRDESRHVLFGVKFLYDMVQASDKYAYRIVDFINRLLPDLYLNGRPLPELIPMMLQTGQDIDFSPKFYASALRRKLRAMGIQASIPDPQPTPIPDELKASVM